VLFCPRALLNICLFNTSYTILYNVHCGGSKREGEQEDDPLPPPPRRSLCPGYYLEKLKWENAGRIVLYLCGGEKLETVKRRTNKLS
jgi:hypothetical protein